jgi:hypothetical protein
VRIARRATRGGPRPPGALDGPGAGSRFWRSRRAPRRLGAARATSLAEIFGSRHYGAIAGAVALGANAARAIGPVGASLLWRALGSNLAVFWLLSASLVVAALALPIVGPGSPGGQ